MSKKTPTHHHQTRVPADEVSNSNVRTSRDTRRKMLTLNKRHGYSNAATVGAAVFVFYNLTSEEQAFAYEKTANVFPRPKRHVSLAEAAANHPMPNEMVVGMLSRIAGENQSKHQSHGINGFHPLLKLFHGYPNVKTKVAIEGKTATIHLEIRMDVTDLKTFAEQASSACADVGSS